MDLLHVFVGISLLWAYLFAAFELPKGFNVYFARLYHHKTILLHVLTTFRTSRSYFDKLWRKNWGYIIAVDGMLICLIGGRIANKQVIILLFIFTLSYFCLLHPLKHMGGDHSLAYYLKIKSARLTAPNIIQNRDGKHVKT